MKDFREIVEALFEGNVAALSNAVIPSCVVQDQRLGRLEGTEGLARWVEDSAQWLRALNAKPTELAYLEDQTRAVHELSFAIEANGETVDLPFVLVADRGEGGVTELRTYHSTWPYTGGHVFRAPPLAGRPTEPVPEIFQWYIDRISVADVDAVLARFTEDGYVREPSGDRWKHQGPQGRAKFYGHLVDAPRARFELMTSTVAGNTIAVEYAFAYGPTDMVGGVCIMEVEGDRLAAIRITDDVSA
ncbi:MAG: nuclear transport factor 2 family protein [Myxococcota bacterium]